MSLKQRLAKVEKLASPKMLVSVDRAIRHIQAEREFQERLNQMKVEYRVGEPASLLTSDEIL